MPAMGDSVAEGTVLEWHKQEGDTVAVDDTIVEISTDKVDAEVPAPVAGTLVKIHAAEGDTVAVGALLAEIATSDGSEAAATEAPANGGASVPEPGPSAPAETIEIVTPTGGESVTEGTILEWAVKVGDQVKDGDTVVEISTDKVDMELPAPASGTITEILAEEGATVTVGQVIARMTAGVGAGAGNGASAPAPAAGQARPARPQPARSQPARPRPPPAPPRPRPRPARAMPHPSPGAWPPTTASTCLTLPGPPAEAGSPRPTCWPPPLATARQRHRPRPRSRPARS